MYRKFKNILIFFTFCPTDVKLFVSPFEQFIFLGYNADNRRMKGVTIQEIADALGITYFAARQRIVRARIEPISKEALYPEDTLERVRNVPSRGRPPKVKPEQE
jgi:hypothetical protein